MLPVPLQDAAPAVPHTGADDVAVTVTGTVTDTGASGARSPVSVLVMDAAFLQWSGRPIARTFLVLWRA